MQHFILLVAFACRVNALYFFRKQLFVISSFYFVHCVFISDSWDKIGERNIINYLKFSYLLYLNFKCFCNFIIKLFEFTYLSRKTITFEIVDFAPFSFFSSRVAPGFNIVTIYSKYLIFLMTRLKIKYQSKFQKLNPFLIVWKLLGFWK